MVTLIAHVTWLPVVTITGMFVAYFEKSVFGGNFTRNTWGVTPATSAGDWYTSSELPAITKNLHPTGCGAAYLMTIESGLLGRSKGTPKSCAETLVPPVAKWL